MEGSTLRHVLVMTGAGSIGLVSIFAVDLLNLFYISLLRDQALTAAVGFASTILFLLTSFCIGMMIAISALVSRALGAEKRAEARRLGGSGTVWSFVLTLALTLLCLPFLGTILDGLGAQGEAREAAHCFLLIALPSAPLMALGMAYSAVLRSVGDAKRGMWVTLSGGLATAVLDPLLIFGFNLGLDGAAIATVLSRLVFVVMGFYGAVRVHQLVERPTLSAMRSDAMMLYAIALPAVLTNIATPVANGFMTAILSPFGDDAVAANAVITRLVPVAFGVTFALSAAVGPILGQNYGAGRMDRVWRAFCEAGAFALFYCLVVWGVLWLSQGAIISTFGLTGDAAELIKFFCVFIAWSWAFHGLMFVANASFNNLGYPLLSTAFNWGKATLGTIPFALYGAHISGAEGALMGQALGAVLFGLGSLIAVWMTLGKKARMEKATPPLL